MTTLYPTANYRLCRKKYPAELRYQVQIDSLVLQRLYMDDKGNRVWQDVEDHIEMVETGLTEKNIQKMTKGCDSCKHQKSDKSIINNCDYCVGDYSKWEAKE